MLAGRIDEFDRALLFVSIRATQSAASQSLEVWIDTGFTGDLVVSKELVIQLGLPQSAMVAAALADGSKSILETFSCVVDWFGQSREVEVIIENPIQGISTIGNVKDPSPPPPIGMLFMGCQREDPKKTPFWDCLLGLSPCLRPSGRSQPQKTILMGTFQTLRKHLHFSIDER